MNNLSVKKFNLGKINVFILIGSFFFSISIEFTFKE